MQAIHRVRPVVDGTSAKKQWLPVENNLVITLQVSVGILVKQHYVVVIYKLIKILGCQWFSC